MLCLYQTFIKVWISGSSSICTSTCKSKWKGNWSYSYTTRKSKLHFSITNYLPKLWNFKSFLDFLPWQSCGISGLWPVGPCNKTRTPCVRSRMLRTHISSSLPILQKTAVTDKSYNCLTYKSWNNNETNTLVNLIHKNFKRGNLDYMEANSVGHLPIWTSNTSR